MIAVVTEQKTLAKHIPCECKCKYDSKKCNSNQKWNNNKCWCKCKNKKSMCAKKIIFGILLHVAAKMINIQQDLLTIK